MIRTLGRVLAVVLIAGIVSAGLYALSVTPAVQAMIPARGGPPQGEAIEGGEEQFAYDGERQESFSRDGHRFHGEHKGSESHGAGDEYAATEGQVEHGSGRHEGHGEGGSLIEALPSMAAHMGMILLVVGIVFVLQKGFSFIHRK